jgi:lambda family phage portal protein|nr:phage portal protein [Oceanicaulis sp.]
MIRALLSRALDALGAPPSPPQTETRSLEAAGGGRRWKDSPGVRDGAQVAHGAGATVAMRAQAYVLNNPHGARAVESLVSSIVGEGFTPRSMHPSEAMRDRLARAFWELADDIDAEGMTDFGGLKASAVRDMVIFGEAVFIWTGQNTLRRLHPEQLDRAKTARLETSVIVQGVEFDLRTGQRIAYWLRPYAPGDSLAGLPGPSVRYPAGEVLHMFRPLMPGQVRGLSWFAPVLLTAHELAQLMDAMLVRAKVAALHTGFITDTDGAPPYEGEQTGGTFEASLEPGAMINLPPGKSIEFSEPPDAGNTPAFAAEMLRMIAVGTGVTYEQLTGDYSKVNYSSARAALLEFQRFIRSVQHHTVVHQFCRPVWARFMRWQVLRGGVPASAYQRDRASLLAVKWLPPAFPWVDPEKDAKAAILEMENHLRSRAEIVAERGYDVERLDQEIAADVERMRRLGLSAPNAVRQPEPDVPENTGDEADEGEPTEEESDDARDD